MSTSNQAKKINLSKSIDAEFIGLINSLNEYIKEFYEVLKFNAKELDVALTTFEPQWNLIISLLNNIENPNTKVNVNKIMEIIIRCKNIVVQLKENSELNTNNLTHFFDDAKIIFKKMREKRKENIEMYKNTAIRDENRFNQNRNNFRFNTSTDFRNFSHRKDDRYLPKNAFNKLYTYILGLKQYNELIGKFSEEHKKKYMNLQKLMIETLRGNWENKTLKKLNVNSEMLILDRKKNIRLDNYMGKIENNFEKNNDNLILLNKAKKYDELKERFELLSENRNKSFNDNDFDKKILNLIDTKKKFETEIQILKNDFHKLELDNIQLKKDLLAKEKEIVLSKMHLSDKNNDNSVLILKKNIEALYKENNNLKNKLRLMSPNQKRRTPRNNTKVNNLTENSFNQEQKDINCLNKKIEELTKLLAEKMEKIIILEKENMELKSMTDNSFPNKNSGKRLNILSNNNTNRINQMDNNDLLEENRRLKTLNVNTKNSLMKLANENKNLKIKLRKLEENNNHIINMQKEVNQLKNLITENNLTNYSSNLTNSNIEYEQKINTLQNILDEKEALIQKYEVQIQNMNINSLKNEKEIALLNQKLKANGSNNNKLLSPRDTEKKKLENMNFTFNIQQLKEEISNLKNLNEQITKEKEILEKNNENLSDQNAIINQQNSELLQKINSIQNQNQVDNDYPLEIKKKEEEIEGLNSFIEKLTNENLKIKEDIENYQSKMNILLKENISIKKQLEHLAVDMPKELNALQIQLDEANKKLSENNNDNNQTSKSNIPNKMNKSFDEETKNKIDKSILSKLNKQISDLKNKNKELLNKLENKEENPMYQKFRTEEVIISECEEEYDLKKMLTGARNKNRSEDINIDYPGMQGYKDKLKEISFKFNNLQEQIKILLSKIKISNSIKPAFVQICQLLGYKSEVIEIMANSEKERKRILEIKL